jgi:hypothetical protein
MKGAFEASCDLPEQYGEWFTNPTPHTVRYSTRLRVAKRMN